MQHTPAKNTKFGGLDNLEELARQLDKAHSHIGNEHTVISACALGPRPHHAIPVAAFASCKAPNPAQQRFVFETVSDYSYMAWNLLIDTTVPFVEVPGKRADVSSIIF